ncbi:MAG TPA: TrkH family potassium uptake protein [Bacillus sp. (in: firmicutes)]|uniref:TrkH family potassium uptake protein n=1 Tax=Bacillus litorisediminis TaxID=2922713 RepID=UPI001FAFA365|nr:TrkH family potassium uptake protein [Bacillus litorisediminis]HWO75320.1 TrkH family potassium uptake protein [Bacillus sp. (in: firmicutes)]
MKFLNQHVNPPRLLIFILFCFILLGTFLLKLPIATTHSISWIDALFTAASATTVTGLAVIDTGSSFTLFGEIVILFLIQVGGLGIMSFAVLFFILLGKKISFKERMLIQLALNQTTLGGVIRLVLHLFLFSLIVEGIAVILLAINWVPEFGWWNGIYVSIFHSVSAFNNAGFSIFTNNLMGYVSDPAVNLIISSLFIIGGIGFTVLLDIFQKRQWKNVSLHSKVMIVGTVLFNLFAVLLIFSLEYNNPNTLGNLSASGKILGAFFQGVSPRTAGFNSIDIGSMETSSILFMILLMFIGAGSGSTGGGIKLTTFFVIVLAVISFIKGRDDITVFRRTIDKAIIFRSLAIAMISTFIIFIALFLLNLTERDTPFLHLLFEVVSAFGTVGLSMGVTGSLTSLGKLIIIFVMFIGNIGPLTLAFSLTKNKIIKIKYKLPKEDLLTG